MNQGALQVANRALSALVLVVYLAAIVPVSAIAQAVSVSVPVGTLVELVFDQEITPATASMGQRVNLRVANAVVINGKTVVAAGAMAVGEVTQSIRPGAVGKEGQIGVVAKTVPAVDGTTIPLDGSKVVVGENHATSSIVVTLLCCILGLLQQGGNAVITSGTSLRATVAAPVNVTVN